MAKDLEVAIVFADVVGSTQLYDKFGDTKASETVAHCLDIMKDATYQFNGTVIKTIGDEVMSTFETVDDAMGAAVMMQTRVTSETKDSGIPVRIRIGCHYGPVVQEQNDIFGSAVHTANRMTSQAKAKQIVISGGTVEHMSPELKRQTRQIDVATVRGRLDEVALYDRALRARKSANIIGKHNTIWFYPAPETARPLAGLQMTTPPSSHSRRWGHHWNRLRSGCARRMTTNFRSKSENPTRRGAFWAWHHCPPAPSANAASCSTRPSACEPTTYTCSE